MIEENRPLKVFLCHARADRDAVRGLYSRLTKDGVDAWLSSRSPKGLSRTEQGISISLTHAHVDRDPVRGLYIRLTKDGVDAWLDKAKLLPDRIGNWKSARLCVSVYNLLISESR